ncbi:hypothetical protein [Streptomyces bikiniensis]|uniref:hypothetical protein n=1 Tax=Streptomyces bikiniensis TaxID=1896 RepID=UPI000B178E30|nr:hypothetical protein [Streptomyces bikiniensis]
MKFTVQTLATAGELQCEPAYDGLRTTEPEPAERAALDQGVTVRRGQGCTLRVTAVPTVHRRLLDRCQPLDGGQGLPRSRPGARPAASTRAASAPWSPDPNAEGPSMPHPGRHTGLRAT